MFSDDTRCRPQQFLVKETAKEKSFNLYKPIKRHTISPTHAAIPHNALHLLCCPSKTNNNKFPYSSGNGAVDLTKAAFLGVF